MVSPDRKENPGKPVIPENPESVELLVNLADLDPKAVPVPMVIPAVLAAPEVLVCLEVVAFLVRTLPIVRAQAELNHWREMVLFMEDIIKGKRGLCL